MSAMDQSPLKNSIVPKLPSRPLRFRGLQPGQWLILEKVPSPFAHAEALLICQLSPREWLTWIPEYGEYLLSL